MSGYYPANICENGHVLSSYGDYDLPYCPKCGALSLSECPNCHQPIRGRQDNSYAYFGDYNKPMFCPYCSKPYPWTKKTMDSAVELLALSEESLDAETRELLKNCLPDLMTDTPVSKVAAARWGQFLAKSGSLVKNAAHEIFNGIVTEAALKILFN